MKKIVLPALLLICCSWFSIKQTGIEKIQASIVSKQLEGGKSIILKSDIFYQANGDCVTHFTEPVEYFVMTNKLGEVKVYDPVKSTVIVQQNDLYSSKTTPFYFFLSGKSNDMGLSDLGFAPVKTYPEKNSLISEWKNKKTSVNIPVQHIKLVHREQNPIYMEYKSSADKVLRKVYYYNYTKINQFNFPATTTDIVYNTKIKDSSITKTTYSNIKINAEATGNFFNFKVPASARKIN